MKMRDILHTALIAVRRGYYTRARRLREYGIFSCMWNSSGYVLVIVLLVTSLLVSVSAEFLITAQTNVNYIRKFSEKMRAHYIAKTGISLGTFILEADRRGASVGILTGSSGDSNVDSYRDIWALDFPEMPFEDGTLKISITDENAKINLSVLANEVVDRSPYYSITQRFFLNMGLPMDIADALIDWVDIDDSRFPYGAESSDYYQTLPHPYKAKNAEMDSIQEMLLVKYITPELYYGLGGGNFGLETNCVDDNRGTTHFDMPQLIKTASGKNAPAPPANSFKTLENPIGREKSRRLSDYFRVTGERSDYLSERNKININTAPFRVLSALTDTMTDDIVAEIIRRRQGKPFSSVDEVKDLIPDDTVRRNILSVRSYIFQITAAGKVNSTRVKIVAIYGRDNKKFYYAGEE